MANISLREKYENLMVLRNLSHKTISAYLGHFDSLIDHDPNFFDLDKDEMISYISKKIKNDKLSASYVAQVVSVVNRVLTEVLGKDVSIKLPRPKREQKHPDILSLEEVTALLNSVKNLKHRTLLSIIYSTGLRVSEALNLKPTDIDSKNEFIIIRNGKGKIDRKGILDPKIFKLIKEYYNEYLPGKYLFVGSKGDKYSDRSVQNIVKKACKAAGIHKHITTHSLRHSCFTQLLKNGVDIRYIQKLAGHKNINTTAKYLQIQDIDVLTIKSPYSYL